MQYNDQTNNSQKIREILLESDTTTTLIMTKSTISDFISANLPAVTTALPSVIVIVKFHSGSNVDQHVRVFLPGRLLVIDRRETLGMAKTCQVFFHNEALH